MEKIQAQLTEFLGPNALIILVGLIGFFLVLVTLPVLLKKDDDPLNRLKSSGQVADKKGAKGAKLRTASSKDKLEKYSSFSCCKPGTAEKRLYGLITSYSLRWEFWALRSVVCMPS